MAAVLKLGNILPHTHWGVLLCFMELFALASVALAMLLSTFFNKARLAAACTGIIYFCLYLPFIFIAIQDDGVISYGVKLVASLSSTTAFGLGTTFMANYERAGVGSQWSNLHEGATACDPFNLGTCFVMLALDATVYLLLAWYACTVLSV